MFDQGKGNARSAGKLTMENTFTFNLHDIELQGQYWTPESVKGVIVLIHGMGEHMLRHEKSVMPHLVDSGYAVVAMDLYGHGRSKGKRGHCPSYKSLLDAVDYTIAKAKELFPQKEIYLYGHSMGGNIAINYVLNQSHTLKGAIATSPLLRLAFSPPKWKMTFGKILLHIAPSLTLPSELDAKFITRDLNEVKRYEEDVLIHDRISPMYSFPMFEAGKQAIRKANELQIPMLVLHGTGDRITDYQGSQDFCKNANNAQLELFENGYHELHHDLCKEEFIKTIIKWLDNM